MGDFFFFARDTVTLVDGLISLAVSLHSLC